MGKMMKLSIALCITVSLAHAEMIRSQTQEVVQDTETNLLWQDNSDAKTVTKNLRGAIGYCQNLNLHGITGWRLPDKNTLKVLYSKKGGLQNTASGDYWSVTDYVVGATVGGLSVNFGNGYVNANYGTNRSYYVRCVRYSETLTFDSFISLYGAKANANPLVLKSKKPMTNDEFLFVKTPEGNFAGTANEILAKPGIQKQAYSKTPFADIQKLTQKSINDYLSIPVIAQPTLPPPLKILKDEFESKAEFAARVQNETAKRESTILAIQEDYRKRVEERNGELEKRKANIQTMQKEFLFQNFAAVMGNPKLSNPVYDAETSTMYVDVAMSNADWKKKVGIKLEDKAIAKELKSSLDKAVTSVTFGYENDSFVLKSIDVGFESQKYAAVLSDKDFKAEKVAVTLESKKVAFNELQNPNLVDKYQVQAMGYSESAGAKGLKYTDDLTPKVTKLAQSPVSGKKWLFAIAIEKYDEADPVIYANNSAKAFISAAQKRLGIDDRHTYKYIDDKATGSGIKNNLERFLENIKDGDTIYFYYSGHGIPSPVDGEAFILPKDAIADYITREKEFMARNIYKKLSDSKAGKVFAFVDSCYSGKTDNIANIKGVAAGVFKTKKVEFDKNKMVVMTAGTSGQFSNAFNEKGHRLFTYYLTKAIIERPTLDMESLYQEVALKVKDESFKKGDIYKQEPQIEGNTKLEL